MNEMEYPRVGEAVCRQTLPNGLEVITVKKPYHTRSYAFFAVRYGGMDLRFRHGGRWQEVPAGVAHYLEHKMFDMETGNVMAEFAQRGAADNAFTSSAMTAYYFTSTSQFYENLRTLLRYVSTPYFTQESVNKERGIIAQEIQETEDDPDWRVYANLMECLYQNSPARIPVAGSVESIRLITPQTLYQCYNTFYTPSNMLLVCVGNMDPRRVAEEAEAILPRTGGPAVERDYGAEESPAPARAGAVQSMEVSMPMFLAGYKCTPQPDGPANLRQSIIGDMACDALFGSSSPLFTRLYGEGLINSSLGGNFDILPGAEYVYVGGDAKDPRRIFDELTRQAQKMGQEGIDGDFYRQIRRSTYGGMLRSLNSLENIAISLTEGYFRGFDYFRFPEIFDTVEKADVEGFLRENFTPERAALSVIQPLA